MRTISLFQNALTPSPCGEMPIKDALAGIKSGLWKTHIEKVRAALEKNEDAYRESKKQLPALTFSGRFNHRKISDPTFRHSKILLCDIDHINGNLPEVRAQIESDPHVAFNFVSPSNHGLKPGVFFKGQLETDADHKRCFAFVEKYFLEKYDLKLDPACKDISRLCFVSYDPDIYLNRDAIPFNVPKIQPKPKKQPITNQNKNDAGTRALEVACSKILMSVPGEQHHVRLKMAKLVGGYIAGGMLAEYDALFQLEKAVSGSGAKDMKASMKDIADGIEHGRTHPISKEELEKQKREYAKNKEIAVKKKPDVTTVTPVTPVTSGDISAIFGDITVTQQENVLSSIYKRCNFSETALLEDVAKSLKNRQTPQPIEDIEYTLFSTFVTCCHLRNNLSLACHKPVTKIYNCLNFKDLIECFVLDSIGWFKTRDVYEAAGARNPKDKNTVRVNLKRLVDAGTIERHQTKNGGYRKIDTEAPRMDFMNYESVPDIGIVLPFGLHEMVQIMPGNIILVAGSPNAGKTAFLLNCALENLKRFNVRYLNSEMGTGELKLRMEKFEGVPLSYWADNNFDPRDRPQGHFQDAILTGEGNINIIDFLEVHEEFYAVGGMIRAIYEKLNGAIAIIALQKNKGSDYGRGGEFTMEKPRLAVALDYQADKNHGVCKITKAKNWKGTENPNGLSCDFKTRQGANISRCSQFLRR